MRKILTMMISICAASALFAADNYYFTINNGVFKQVTKENGVYKYTDGSGNADGDIFILAKVVGKNGDFSLGEGAKTIQSSSNYSSLAIGKNSQANAGNIVAIGNQAGQNSTNNSGSVFIGARSGLGSKKYDAQPEWGSIFIGQDAGNGSKGDANFYIGSSTGQNHRGSQNIFLGDTAKTIKHDAENVDSTSSSIVNVETFGNRNIYIGNRYVHGNVPKSDDYINDTIAIGTLASADKSKGIAIGSSSSGSKIGALSIGKNSIAIGTSTSNSKNGATAKGDNSISFGADTLATAIDGIALGSSSIANEEFIQNKQSVYLYDDDNVKNTVENTKGALSVGSDGKETKRFTRQIINVAAGSKDSDAVNVAQLKAVQQVANQGNKWIAADNSKNKANTEAKGENSVAIGPGSNTKIIVNGKPTERSNTVSVGSKGNKRTISNVAPGVYDSDAATVGQLKAGLNNVYGKLDEYKKDSHAGTASAMAIGNLPQSTIPGKGMVSLGGGFYDGESAMAIGLSKMSDDGKWVVKGSASYDSQENAGAAVSVGFHF